ncbi:acyl carrier protein [Streptomyces noursei]|uniref:acyl carrier protein n=1 Tax=Streptomyces noursei TaxID=1971 RepID=UPI00382324DF
MTTQEEESMTTVTDEIREFLGSATGEQVGPDDDYFARGLVDSLFALELVTFVERRFGVVVEVEDLSLDNFRTAANIAGYVGRKTSPGGTEVTA